ncbi:IclR family transcriptional regulator [Teichococcus aestuarii]|uniref:IclR family transcriptional regulator n=1 Tax=Teichococcus aestuarii TaxID=568898 RepID=UPI00360E7AF4
MERVEGGRRHRLGAALVALAGQAADGTGLRRLCRPALARLSGESGETTFLIVRSGLNAVVTDRQDGAYVIESLTQGVGGLMPLGIGAGSATILASQTPAEIEAVLAANAARYRQFGSSAEQVRRRVEQVRSEGYLMSDDLLIAGLAVIGLAIRPPGRAVTAAIATNFIASRLDAAARRQFLARMRQEAAMVEASRRCLPPSCETLAPENPEWPATICFPAAGCSPPCRFCWRRPPWRLPRWRRPRPGRTGPCAWWCPSPPAGPPMSAPGW